jgi:hypothetical protein
MPRLKYYNPSTEQWEYVAVGAQGPSGIIVSDTAPESTNGLWLDSDEEAEVPVPEGGTTGQVLVKSSNDDYDTEWTSLPEEVFPTGGTTGQVLVKSSNDDYDTEWTGAYGSTLITTVNFTSQSSVSLNNIFNSNFINYEYFLTASTNTVSGVQGRLRSGSTDLSSATYNHQRLYASGTTVGAYNGLSTTSWELGVVRTAGVVAISGVISNPFTVGETQQFTKQADRPAATEIGFSSGYNTSSVSYDGMTFFLSSGAMTGTISIYGRNL